MEQRETCSIFCVFIVRMRIAIDRMIDFDLTDDLHLLFVHYRKKLEVEIEIVVMMIDRRAFVEWCLKY